MEKVFNALGRLFNKPEPISPGIYPYQSPPDAERQIRFHLRVHPDGSGLLILNASTVLHLNQTGAEFAYHLAQGTPVPEAVQQIASRYQISPAQIREDFQEFQHQINTMLEVEDLDPVTYFNLEREQPYTGAKNAPYRLDCALTYQLPENSHPDLAPLRRVDRELETSEWKQILDKAWKAGIPQVIFTGGEPTLREDLLKLIAHAEKNGQVTGLLSAGQRLSDPIYREDLLQTGLDHLMYVLSPQEEESWDTLGQILPEDLFTTVHLTLKPEWIENLTSYLNTLGDLNANALSLSVNDPEDPTLRGHLDQARDLAAENGLTLKWDLPVPYSRHNPVALEIETDRGAQPGKAVLYVEPDGDVLPAQGVNQVLGNLLTGEWESIWGAASASPPAGS